MSEDSIDFQPIPGEESQDMHVRHLFRVPVTLKDGLRIYLSDNDYCVTNLSTTGIAVSVSSCLEFDSGQMIDNVTLRTGDIVFTGLCAKVIHCSVNDSGSFQFGLQWVNMSAEDKNKLAQALEQLKLKALETKDLPEEPF